MGKNTSKNSIRFFFTPRFFSHFSVENFERIPNFPFYKVKGMYGLVQFQDAKQCEFFFFLFHLFFKRWWSLRSRDFCVAPIRSLTVESCIKIIYDVAVKHVVLFFSSIAWVFTDRVDRLLNRRTVKTRTVTRTRTVLPSQRRSEDILLDAKKKNMQDKVTMRQQTWLIVGDTYCFDLRLSGQNSCHGVSPKACLLGDDFRLCAYKLLLDISGWRRRCIVVVACIFSSPDLRCLEREQRTHDVILADFHASR